MVLPETRKFVEENRELLEKLVKHGSPSIRPIALAFLLAVDMEEVRKNEGEEQD
jgi:hypothetical protein